MKILMAASEVTPIAKVGGLADVVSALSKELAGKGHEVRIVCPFYGSIKKEPSWKKRAKELRVCLPGINGKEICHIWDSKLQGSNVILHLIDYPKYFRFKEIYGVPGENFERFTVFSRAVIDLCNQINWIPDLVHCHDWMTALIPLFIKIHENGKKMGKVSSVLTIHNLLYQGKFGYDAIKFAGLEEGRADLHFGSCINFLKAGLLNAHKISTVSPSYAKEIKTKAKGCGLEPIINKRKNDVIGILNGVDHTRWDPATDKRISSNFSLADLSGKQKCKQSLQEEFSLDCDPSIPLFGAVARLYQQKGIDMLLNAIPALLKETKLQIIIQGQGDKLIEEKLIALANAHPSIVGVYVGHSSLSVHQILSGSDFFVMPSRFEPCGLTQMYSMIYGSIPVVSPTGGLKDTVVDISKKNATGIFLAQPTVASLTKSIRDAAHLFTSEKEKYHEIQRNAMLSDFSWKQSVLAYEALYHDACLKTSK